MRMGLSRVAALALACALAVPGAAAAASPPPGSAAARERAMKAIVHAWSARLNARDNDGVARLFAMPATVTQVDKLLFTSRVQLADWHSQIPCSGHITSIAIKGRFATAAFRLGDRRGAPCASRGVVVAARFEIVRGKIVTWVQIPVPASQLPFSGSTA